MSWFDDPAAYYGDGFDVISQGDIIFAPSAVLVGGAGGVAGEAPKMINEERLVSLWTATTGRLPEAPSVAVRAQWGVAMVLPHPCALEKEFNERIEELIARGVDQQAAEDIANEDQTLDRHIALAPLRLYDTLPEQRRAGARQGARLGAFPVVASTEFAIPESYVDLSRITTVDIGLLPLSLRIASLSDLSRSHLQVGLAMFWAYRHKSRLDELERAVGQKISAVHPVRGAKRLSVSFVLEDGHTLTLEGSTASEPQANAPERRKRATT